MMSINFNAPQRPIDYVEQTLVALILDGSFPAGSTLPAERELAARLGITRPTLREALRYLERDGWLTIQQGKSTVVNDCWRDGNMNVITTLIRHQAQLPARLVPDLLRVRIDLAPSYFAAAAARRPAEVASLLTQSPTVTAPAAAFAAFDWQLHREMTILSGNPVYTLILNGFAGFYEQMAQSYFEPENARQISFGFYRDLRDLIRRGEVDGVRPLVERVMRLSLELWPG